MHSVQLEKTAEATSQDSTWSNPVTLSRKVRELAYRSHVALKSSAAAGAPTQASSQVHADDLRELGAQVVRLQQKIHERRLERLIPWVDTLSRRLEHQLGKVCTAGTH